ncbi:MAG: CvpA family protein [Gammaproteobacteria bacterium]|jgi:membrane protein required for colicin V production
MLNWADYAILIIVGVSTLVSLVRGFVREAISLCTWIIAAWIAFKFSSLCANLFIGYIKTPSLRLVVAFLILFVGILIIGALINFLIYELISHTGLSGTDRVLGMLFGAGRGLLLVGVLVLLGNMSAATKDKWWTDSVLIPRFQGLATWLHSFLPEKINEWKDDSP